MAEAGEARSHEYIAITDHSKGLKIAGGIAG
jgi:histidinol phosphatase-like PHP family hydrolase